jgi:uncharacterized protein
VTSVTLHRATGAEMEELAAKERALDAILRGLGRTVVAYSGGVDSAFLLAAAHRALGPGALGVIAKSPSLPAAELEEALETARRSGIPVRVIETRELEREGYRANGRDRCYHCKTELFERLAAMASDEGWETIAYGAVTDDLGDDRPGMGAAKELRIRAPLLEAGLSKWHVRILARRMGLSTWDKPQAACLASRIPHGAEVTARKLGEVEGAEAWIRGRYGVRVLRVRHLGASARVETDPSDIQRLTVALPEIRSEMARWGFQDVIIDPAGYRRPDPLPVEPQEDKSNVQRG